MVEKRNRQIGSNGKIVVDKKTKGIDIEIDFGNNGVTKEDTEEFEKERGRRFVDKRLGLGFRL